MDNVTYIVPLLPNKAGEKEGPDEFVLALDSIKYTPLDKENDSIIVVGSEELFKTYYDKLGINEDGMITKVTANTEDVYELVNAAVMECTTEYFSVIEPGETYFPNWAKNARAYGKGCSVIIPLRENVSEKESFLSNELAWSPSFNDENNLGAVTMDFLDKFMDVSLSGAYFNTEDFISIGKFKPSLKIVTWYEFLLRCAYKSKKVFVAPKLGVSRQVSAKADESLKKEEVEWLIKTARQEYFFNEDREKKFEEE